MKKFILCSAMALTMIACGKGGDSAPGGSGGGGGSAAIGADGQCTPQFVGDTEKVQEIGKQMLIDLAEEMTKLKIDSKPGAEQNSKIDAIRDSVRAQLRAYLDKYGKVVCRTDTLQIDSSKIEEALVGMDQKQEEPPSVIAKDGDCSPSIQADYGTLQSNMKGPFGEYMQTMSSMMKKAALKLSTDSEAAQMKALSLQTWNIVQAFKKKHPEVFACNFADPISGQKRVISSDEIDQVMSQIQAAANNF